jgi:hypothetical protein
MVLNPPPTQSSTPRGHEEDEKTDDEDHDRDDVDRPQERAQSDVYDLFEFTTWYLMFFGGQRSGGSTTARENQCDDMILMTRLTVLSRRASA